MVQAQPCRSTGMLYISVNFKEVQSFQSLTADGDEAHVRVCSQEVGVK